VLINRLGFVKANHTSPSWRRAERLHLASINMALLTEGRLIPLGVYKHDPPDGGPPGSTDVYKHGPPGGGPPGST